MKLEKWAQTAEIVGAIAIVASLVFVGLQLRQSNQLTRTTAYQQNIDSLIDLRMLVISARLSDEWLASIDSDDDATEAQSDLVVISQIALSIYDKAYVAFQNGIMDPLGWRRFDEGLCRLWQNSAARRSNQELNFLSIEFRSYAGQKCGNE